MSANKYIFVFLTVLPVIFGCASIKEAAKATMGISTKELEDNRKSAIKEKFSRSYDDCYKAVFDGLRERGSYVYAQDYKNKMIAVYVSEEDTTPVGIFFKIVDDKSTQVEVSSPSTYARELIANKVKNILIPEEKKGNSHAEKTAN